MNVGSCYGRFYAGHRETSFGMYSNIISSLVHFAIAYYLAVYLKWEMLGVCYASCFHFFMRWFILFLCGKFLFKYPESFVPFSDPDNYKNITPQFILSLKCASLGIWAWWAFDVFTLIASYMSIDDLAAQTVLRNIGLITFMIPVGIAVSAIILVGNMIGAGKIEAA